MKIKTVVLLSFISTLIMMAIMMLHGAPLKINNVSPHGIIDLELARTVANATRIYDAWAGDLIDTAIANTSIDFVFILSYGTFLFASSLFLLRKNSGSIKKINRWICIASLIAPLFDGIENILMFRTLSGHFSKEVIASTFIFASVKFILVALAILFLLFSGIALLTRNHVKQISVV